MSEWYTTIALSGDQAWPNTFYILQMSYKLVMGLLPDTKNCVLRMGRECLERFPRHRLQRKPLVSDTGMHHGTCVTHVPWCMSGSLTRGGGENVPGIPGACATCNFKYLARGPLQCYGCDAFYHDFTHSVRLLICTCHNRWAVMICAKQYGKTVKMWPGLVIILCLRTRYTFRRFGPELIQTLWNGSYVCRLTLFMQ